MIALLPRRTACGICYRMNLPLHVRLFFGMPLLLTMLAGCDRSGTEPAARPGPNVLLVSIDTLRADRVGAYGATARASITMAKVDLWKARLGRISRF